VFYLSVCEGKAGRCSILQGCIIGGLVLWTDFRVDNSVNRNLLTAFAKPTLLCKSQRDYRKRIIKNYDCKYDDDDDQGFIYTP